MRATEGEHAEGVVWRVVCFINNILEILPQIKNTLIQKLVTMALLLYIL